MSERMMVVNGDIYNNGTIKEQNKLLTKFIKNLEGLLKDTDINQFNLRLHYTHMAFYKAEVEYNGIYVITYYPDEIDDELEVEMRVFGDGFTLLRTIKDQNVRKSIESRFLPRSNVKFIHGQQSKVSMIDDINKIEDDARKDNLYKLCRDFIVRENLVDETYIMSLYDNCNDVRFIRKMCEIVGYAEDE